MEAKCQTSNVKLSTSFLEYNRNLCSSHKGTLSHRPTPRHNIHVDHSVFTEDFGGCVIKQTNYTRTQQDRAFPLGLSTLQYYPVLVSWPYNPNRDDFCHNTNEFHFDLVLKT